MSSENGIFGEEKNTASLRDTLSVYLSNWPLFLLCLAVCIGAGVFYTRYTVPKYIASTSFLIKGAEGGSRYTNDLIEEAINGKQKLNLNNEILLISSSGLMQRTVAKNNFNISYFKKGKLHISNIYKETPFLLSADKIANGSREYDFYVDNIDSKGGTVKYGKGKKEVSHNFQWNVPFNIDSNGFSFISKGVMEKSAAEYIVRWKPVGMAAGDFLGNLNVKPFDSKTSVIDVSMKTENLQLGKDLLNALFVEFNLSDIEDRKKLSDSTVSFINERLIGVTDELKGVEGNLETFQGSRQLVDVRNQSSQSLANASEASKTITDINLKQKVVDMISNYFANPANSNNLVPSSLGLDDATLSALLAQYNELQLRKSREAPNVAPNSTVMQDLNTQSFNLKNSILENLDNINKNLKLQESSFTQQNRQYNSFLSSLPHNERVLQEIKRKQSITEGLYLYLLQRREEAAISKTSADVSHYRQIDPASGYGPVEPNLRNMIMYTFLLGFFIAFGWIYFKKLLNNKINTAADITKSVSIPLTGQISHISKQKNKGIAVLEDAAAGEQFRSMRTNLSFLLKDKMSKVILVSSSVSREGKSFISLNLAAVCAMPGKKVALLEFDIRKPVLANRLYIENGKGLTDYLLGTVSNVQVIANSIDAIPGLDVYTSGSNFHNAGDLLLSANISTLFEKLKQNYDYIIVDSPPAELVSDVYILSEYCDMALFVIRQRVTLKRQLDFINELVIHHKFKKTSLVLNDIKAAGKNDYYDYSYTRAEQKINRNSNGVEKLVH